MISLSFLTLLAAGGPPVEPGGAPPAGVVPNAMVELEWNQRPNFQIPLDLTFRDESGQPVVLRQLVGNKPIVLVLAYYRCPQLCNLVLNGVLDAIRNMPLKLGDDFEIVTVSFDARETAGIAAAKKENYLAGYPRPGAERHWHFLTGDEASIAPLAEAVGFRYRYDAAHDRFDHASGITILTPDGRVSRYLFGIRFQPRDLRLALVEASQGQVGGIVEQFMLACFHYDAAKGKYGFAVLAAMRWIAALTVLTMAWFVIRAARRERRNSRVQLAP